MKKLRLALAAALVLAAFATSAPRAEAAHCGLYQNCMRTTEGDCLCAGFICEGQFICGIPAHP